MISDGEGGRLKVYIFSKCIRLEEEPEVGETVGVQLKVEGFKKLYLPQFPLLYNG